MVNFVEEESTADEETGSISNKEFLLNQIERTGLVVWKIHLRLTQMDQKVKWPRKL